MTKCQAVTVESSTDFSLSQEFFVGPCAGNLDFSTVKMYIQFLGDGRGTETLVCQPLLLMARDNLTSF